MAWSSLSDTQSHDLPFNLMLHFAVMQRSMASIMMLLKVTGSCRYRYGSVLNVLQS